MSQVSILLNCSQKIDYIQRVQWIGINDLYSALCSQRFLYSIHYYVIFNMTICYYNVHYNVVFHMRKNYQDKQSVRVLFMKIMLSIQCHSGQQISIEPKQLSVMVSLHLSDNSQVTIQCDYLQCCPEHWFEKTDGSQHCNLCFESENLYVSAWLRI